MRALFPPETALSKNRLGEAPGVLPRDLLGPARAGVRGSRRPAAHRRAGAGAHGANRTGRVFTGDGKGGSGDFLMAALHRTGFANQPTSTDAGDGLRLLDAFITMAVRCAPPDNTPTREEAQNCLPHLDAEVAVLPKVVVVVALGAIGFGAYLRLLRARGAIARPAPAFEHGAAHRLPTGVTLLGCYHPSRQNTNTGRLTPAMMIDVFEDARRRIRESAARSILPSAPPSAPSTDRGGRR
jgi:uracil-DNA glycosylase family 4